MRAERDELIASFRLAGAHVWTPCSESESAGEIGDLLQQFLDWKPQELTAKTGWHGALESLQTCIRSPGSVTRPPRSRFRSTTPEA